RPVELPRSLGLAGVGQQRLHPRAPPRLLVLFALLRLAGDLLLLAQLLRLLQPRQRRVRAEELQRRLVLRRRLLVALLGQRLLGPGQRRLVGLLLLLGLGLDRRPALALLGQLALGLGLRPRPLALGLGQRLALLGLAHQLGALGAGLQPARPLRRRQRLVVLPSAQEV